MKKLKNVPVTNRGQWDYPGMDTIVPSGQITMQGVPYPVMGMDNTGHSMMMMPGGEYSFPGDMVYETPMLKQGGYVVTRSNDRKGKTHKVTGPDGTVKYFGDSELGQHPKDPERKAAFYARHKKNLENNPYFRAFARKTWEEGGEIDEFDVMMMQNGGEMIRRADGSYSKRGLWDNIRANKGSGKAPTKEMLDQERKIRREEKAFGGVTGWLDQYQNGGENLPELNSNLDVANFYKNPLSEKYGVTKNPENGRFEYYAKTPLEVTPQKSQIGSAELRTQNINKGFDPSFKPNVAISSVINPDVRQRTLRRLENEQLDQEIERVMAEERSSMDPIPALTSADFPTLPPEPRSVVNTAPKTKELPNKKKAVQVAVTQSLPVHNQTAVGPPQPLVLPNNIVNLADVTMTAADLAFLNNTPEYCPGGNCLETTRKAYDMLSARIPGVPTSSAIWKDINASSTNRTPTAAEVAKYPWYKGDSKTGAADSWDIHGNIVASGGKNIYNANNPKHGKIADLYKQIPIGTVIGYGPKGTDASNYPERNEGYNRQFGLQPSHHSTQVVGYTPQGEPIVYDGFLKSYVPLSQMEGKMADRLGYEIENISVPKSVADKNRESFQKQGTLLNYVQPLNANPQNIINAGKQPWAQIKDGSSTRTPDFDVEALQKFTHSLQSNKGMLMQNLGLTSADYDELAKTAIAISAQETEGGGALGMSDVAGNTQGMTQLNLDNITKDDRLRGARSRPYHNHVIVDSNADLRTPEGSAVATMMHLSQLKKDADRMFKAGSSTQTRTFNENSGLADVVRSNTARYNGDGFFVEEGNKRVDLSQYEGGVFSDANPAAATAYLNKVAGTKDKYKVVLDADGNLQVQMKTAGNNPNLTTVQKIAYAWQSPNTLLKGDAAGDSQYAQRIQNYYNALNTAPVKKKQSTGGEIEGWLNKYN